VHNHTSSIILCPSSALPRPEKEEPEPEEKNYNFVGPKAEEQVMWQVLVRWLHKGAREKMRRREIYTFNNE
jgi:hypothetical protein